MAGHLTEITPEFLQRVKGVIETRGWTQGAFVTDDGCCLMAAVAIADKGITPYSTSFFATETACTPFRKLFFDMFFEEFGLGPVMWNDEEGRTVEEVYDLIDQMISHLESN